MSVVGDKVADLSNVNVFETTVRKKSVVVVKAEANSSAAFFAIAELYHICLACLY